MHALARFFLDGARQVFSGSRTYWSWMGGLTAVAVIGVMLYSRQLEHGMIVTGMSDQVSWGAYIANFTYLVGVAAAAVMLVIPAYIFNRQDIKHVVLIGEGIAVAAVVMCILFVTVDLGRPDRIWHLIPLLGRFHFPESMLAWDVLVLSGYLLLNLGIPFYILFSRYRGIEPSLRLYFPAVVLSMLWAISIHTVTAFLFSSNVARPFWHTAILGPRFLASAFTSGPALIILALQLIDRFTKLKVASSVIDLIALIVTVSLQINLFLLMVELFTEFYYPTEHTVAARYLYLGFQGYDALVPWIWSATALNLGAVAILTVHRWRARRPLLNAACLMAVVGVWIEKGMGLIIPGFVPTPLGEMFDYAPTTVEIGVSLAVWAIGLLIFTALAKVAIPIELGSLSYAGSGRGSGSHPAHGPTGPAHGPTGPAHRATHSRT
jgi:Ni/Fe-hydrogenase subunit HybB-like protein